MLRFAHAVAWVSALVAPPYLVHAQTCAPSVEIVGMEPALNVAVASSLATRGIATTTEGECRAVWAHLSHRGHKIEVQIRDVEGRKSERLVSDVNSAATVIESWTQKASNAMLQLPPDVKAPAIRQAADSETPPPLTKEVQPQIKSASPVKLLGAAESALASDGSLWVSANAGACVLLGPTCTGMFVRMAVDTRASGESERLSTARFALDFMLSSDLPFSAGPIRFRPGVAVGAGWMRTTDGRAGAGGDQTEEFDGGGPRANAHLMAGFSASDQLVLEAGLHGDVLLFAHNAAFREGGANLAGEPVAFLRASFGLRHSLL